MKITMVMVSSLNGKITKQKDSNIYEWTSKEDQKFFFSQLEKNSLIVMGRKTYDAAKRYIVPNKDKLRIVLTESPDMYKKDRIKDQIEFSSDSPDILVNRLTRQGYKKMLLVGGGEINSLFLKAKLVNEISITIEPYIFGSGKSLVADFDNHIRLELISLRKLNKRGTILARYKVIHNSRSD